MPLVATVIADGVKICELAKANHGTVTAFAASIGRPAQSIWNMRGGRTVSETFATQIADALGVPLGEITVAAGADQDVPAEPEMAVA